MKLDRVRSILVATVVAGFLCTLAGTAPGTFGQEADRKQETDRKQYADKVRETYNFRFGKDQLFLPGTMQVEGDDFVQAGAFPDPSYCAHCHQEAYHQWRQAPHSNAFRTPFYRASVNILINTKGIEFARHCDSCHNPIAVLAGGLTEDSKVDRRWIRMGSPAPRATRSRNCSRLRGTAVS